ncbi:MAG: CGNR zinc finger domain-containing protein [Sporichthyaceae bacterium]|nr:CGNR zinc finger domain-containing protein [Sporichthyaceae bacterium]
MKITTLTPTRPVPRALGGRLCLAIVNSVLWRRSDSPDDLLGDYPTFVGYLRELGCIDQPDHDALLTSAASRPAEAGAAFDRLIELRESLFRLFSAAAAGDQPAPADLDALNITFGHGVRLLAVQPSPGGYALTWGPAGPGMDWPIWEVAVSAVAVLGSDDLTALKQCPGESCGWLFIDESRGQNRRWCSSRLCGNRDRVKRHYQRTHELPGKDSVSLAQRRP